MRSGEPHREQTGLTGLVVMLANPPLRMKYCRVARWKRGLGRRLPCAQVDADQAEQDHGQLKEAHSDGKIPIQAGI